MFSRRKVLLAALGLASVGCTTRRVSARPSARLLDEITALEAVIGGRIGVYARWTHGSELGHREDERFTYCSTFKWIVGAAILLGVDQGQLRLDEPIPYSEADLVSHAPVTGAQVAEGQLTVAELCHATITTSDNTAANLLVRRLGGLDVLNRLVQAAGDPVTRFDRWETALNVPDGDLDTTSPRAMTNLLRELLTGPTLTVSSRAQLRAWMIATETGKNRIRAGLPADLVAGDKTGTSGTGLVHDVAFVERGDGNTLFVSVYTEGTELDAGRRSDQIAEVARLLWRELGEA